VFTDISKGENMAITMKKEEKYIKDLKKCAGKYAAEADGEIIACGDTIAEVQKIARQKKVKKPIIFGVPKATKGHLFF
jgi:hypothetical protein